MINQPDTRITQRVSVRRALVFLLKQIAFSSPSHFLDMSQDTGCPVIAVTPQCQI
jgi:hypothetical protein